MARYTVQVLWECEFHQQLATYPEMKDFVRNLNLDTPLEPRHGFFGGHTNAVSLYKEIADEEKIHYVDFTSLYPWTNKNCEVPLGHHEILTSEALVNHSIKDFFSMIKCEILPPSFLFHPLLPYCANGRLMFPLCRTCAKNLQQAPCEHSDSEHTLSGTWPSIEIQKACELGYRVLKLIEV